MPRTLHLKLLGRWLFRIPTLRFDFLFKMIGNSISSFNLTYRAVIGSCVCKSIVDFMDNL
jgi:hypothetical protein